MTVTSIYNVILTRIKLVTTNFGYYNIRIQIYILQVYLCRIWLLSDISLDVCGEILHGREELGSGGNVDGAIDLEVQELRTYEGLSSIGCTRHFHFL